MPEQFELFKNKKKDQSPEEVKEVSPKKIIRKPGSKYYEPGLGTFEEQDDYVQKVLGGSSADITERAKEAAEKAHEEFLNKNKEKEQNES